MEPPAARSGKKRTAPEQGENGNHGDGASQPEGQLHELRSKYRDMMDTMEANKEELTRPEDTGLLKVLQNQDKLFEAVKASHRTTVAALDSEMLKYGAELALQKASRVQTTFQAQEPVELILKLKGQNAQVRCPRRNKLTIQINWSVVGAIALPYFRIMPPVNFMYGPLFAPPKVRKQTVRHERQKDVVAEEVHADENVAQQAGRAATETTRRVEALLKKLTALKKVNFFQLLVDPASYAKTVENVFHLSFLIKDGHAAVEIDEPTGEIFAVARQAGDGTSQTEKREQCIVSIDSTIWKSAIAKYDIKKAMLETPAPRGGGQPPSAIAEQSQASQAASQVPASQDLPSARPQLARKRG